MLNFSTTLFDTSSSLDTPNRFDSLSSMSNAGSLVPDNIAPLAASSVHDKNEAKAKTA